MAVLGYEFLRQSLKLAAFPPGRPALLKPVTRIEQTDTCLAVPRHVAPATDNPVSHVLFALKHEGTDLQILAEALPKIDPVWLVEELRRSPTGTYIRLACYLWEQFSGKQFADLPEISGPTAEVFSSKKYVTGKARRDARWRVAFNGLGSIHYCPMVERSSGVQDALRSDILNRANAFIEGLGKGMMDRALSWAYLHETESSFAIERETPSEQKSRRFVALLHQAHDTRLLSEDYLVDLQNSILTNPYDLAASFRTQQNWLRGPMRGAAGVTYLPPPPEMVPELMQELMDFANKAASEIDPVVAASVLSFGFVFIHPFMDGNGRLSRFLFHQALCQSGRLEKGLLLPVSVAMKRNEDEYLAVLQQFSKPARERWSVSWIDEDQYDIKLIGNPGMYRYWDATRCVEFGYRMAERALEVELREETEFIARYDQIAKAVSERFDVRGNDLSVLILSCLDNNGVMSNRRRKQFGDRVPADVFDFIEQCTKAAPDADFADCISVPNPPLAELQKEKLKARLVLLTDRLIQWTDAPFSTIRGTVLVANEQWAAMDVGDKVQILDRKKWPVEEGGYYVIEAYRDGGTIMRQAVDFVTASALQSSYGQLIGELANGWLEQDKVLPPPL